MFFELGLNLAFELGLEVARFRFRFSLFPALSYFPVSYGLELGFELDLGLGLRLILELEICFLNWA